MILNEFIDNTVQPTDFSLVNDIDGNPFEYMVGAAYECNIIEQQINLYAICEEYSYLREYGSISPVNEANIIATVFTAIKNAIAAAFNKICEFFKSIFSKSEETSTEIKKNADTINKNQAKSSNEPVSVNILYYEINDLEEMAKSLPEIPTEFIEYVKPAITSLYAELGNTITHATPNERLKMIDDIKTDREYTQIKDFINMLNTQGISKTLKYIGADVPNGLIPFIEAIENNNIQLTDLPHTVVEITDRNTVKDAMHYIKNGQTVTYKIKGWLDNAFNLAKKTLSIAKETVNTSEKRVTAILNRSAQARNDQTLSDATKCVQELTSLLNTAINVIDTNLIKIQNVTTKIIMTQLYQYNNAFAKLAKVLS